MCDTKISDPYFKEMDPTSSEKGVELIAKNNVITKSMKNSNNDA